MSNTKDMLEWREEMKEEMWVKLEEYDGSGSPVEAAAKQVGGSHYQLPIQPIDYIVKNDLGYREGNIIKYVTRYKNKNGLQDLEKAKHYLEMLIEEYN